MKSILVFSRDAGWYGGVVNFIDLLKKNISPDIKYTQFKIGRRKGIIWNLLRPIVPLLDAILLINVLIKNEFDAYHLNPSLNFPSLARDGLFMLVLRFFGVKNVLVSFHGWDIPVENIIRSNFILRFLFIRTFGYADYTFVLAKEFKSTLMEWGIREDTIFIFTTMFDSDEFNIDNTNRSHKKTDLLFLSRLVKEKGIYEVVNAVGILVNDYPDIKLIIAGNGDEESNLKKIVHQRQLDNNIHFTGYLRGKDKVDVFNRTGIFVFPTYYGEGCPVSLLEAMAAGHAVITTPVGGIPYIIEDGVNGILISNVNVRSIEDAIRKLLDDENLRASMSYNNHKKAWSKYNAPMVAQYFEKFYRSTVK